MELRFVYMPVADFASSLAFYRDVLGLEEAWREGEEAVGLVLPGTAVQLMVDADPTALGRAGPFFEVDDVDAFRAQHEGRLRFVVEPKDIPPGRYAAFEDPAGNWVHVLDTSKGG